MADFYSKKTPNINYYSSSTYGTEINLREEFINTFDGQFPEIAKAQIGLLRRMRRDSDGELIPCGCIDSITKEPDKDRLCNVCRAEGYLWDEEEIQLYRILADSDVDNALKNSLNPPGLINVPIVVFYIRYDSNITRDDKIVRLVLDTAGDPVEPYQREGIYRINALWDYRADNGKLEYWKVFVHYEDVKHLNAPSYEDL